MIVVTTEVTHSRGRLFVPTFQRGCGRGLIAIDRGDLLETRLKSVHQFFAANLVNAVEHVASFGDDTSSPGFEQPGLD